MSERHEMSIMVKQSADGTFALGTTGDPSPVEVVALAEFAQLLAKSKFFDDLRAAESAAAASSGVQQEGTE